MVIGWCRDAACEPPDWKLKPVLAKQRITITVPGGAADWRVFFYETATGTGSLGSVSVTRKGKTVTIPLPDFRDDIAFKMIARE
ncbi:MAG: hypothetical protein ACM3ZC_11540 [Bacteroidota bacterium]